MRQVRKKNTLRKMFMLQIMRRYIIILAPQLQFPFDFIPHLRGISNEFAGYALNRNSKTKTNVTKQQINTDFIHPC